jgi:lipopolysaccharide transport system permease protein
MQDNVSYVKRVVFPLHVLSWSVALSALFHLVMNTLIFLALAGLVFGGVSSLTFLLPVVIAPLILLTVAISWFLASLGVYIRDIQQVVPVLTTAMFFLSSAVIPVSAVPEKYRFLFDVNPLTFFIDQARNVALWGVPPDWNGLAAYTLASLAILYAGYAWLKLTSKGFADVL